MISEGSELLARPPDEVLDDRRLSKEIECLLKLVSRSEAMILRMKMGLGMDRDFNIDEISEDFAVTKACIRRRIEYALHSLRYRTVVGNRVRNHLRERRGL